MSDLPQTRYAVIAAYFLMHNLMQIAEEFDKKKLYNFKMEVHKDKTWISNNSV